MSVLIELLEDIHEASVVLCVSHRAGGGRRRLALRELGIHLVDGVDVACKSQ